MSCSGVKVKVTLKYLSKVQVSSTSLVLVIHNKRRNLEGGVEYFFTVDKL